MSGKNLTTKRRGSSATAESSLSPPPRPLHPVRASPLSPGHRNTPHPMLAGEMCPRSAAYTLGEGRELRFFLLLPAALALRLGQRPSPPGASPACGRPAAAFPRLVRVPTLGGCSETLCPPPVPSLSHCRRSPARAPPSPNPFTAEPRASLGSRRNRLQTASARSPLPPRAARPRPGPRPLPGPPPSGSLSRPFGCSSQDRGRRAGSRGSRPLSFHFSSGATAAGSQAAGNAAPHRPAR